MLARRARLSALGFWKWHLYKAIDHDGQRAFSRLSLSALLGEIYPELDADILASMVWTPFGRRAQPDARGAVWRAIRCGRNRMRC